MTGIVSLYGRDGGLISSKYYETQSIRKTIINSWATIYARAFLSCYIVIAPEIIHTLTNADGTNRQYRSKLKEPSDRSVVIENTKLKKTISSFRKDASQRMV